MPDNAAEPILERIAVSLAGALADVRPERGYKVKLRRIVRPDKTGIPSGLGHLDVLVGQISDERRPGPQSTATEGRTATFRVFVNVIQSELDGTPADTYLNRVLADVLKALRADRQRSGLAVDTLWGDVAFLIEVGPLDGIAIDVPVIYETAEDDPYSL